MPTKLSLYQRYKARWSNCQGCVLCKTRKHVVLCRAVSLPAPIALIGEAPGESEDVIGSAFVGPAGQLLDRIIRKAQVPLEKIAFTNIICCIPRDEHTRKLATPPKYAIEACTPRLREFVQLVRPKVIVWVGGEASKRGPKMLFGILNIRYFEIIHPAAILRMHPSQTGLAAQRCVVALSDAWELVQNGL